MSKSLAREFRAIRAGAVEARSTEDGGLVIRGLGVVYDKPSQDFGGWREVISDKALRKTLGDGAANVYSTFNHDDNQVLGRVKAGTLVLENTAEGLVYEARLNPASPVHQHVHAIVSDGTVEGSSFTFRLMPNGAEWSESEDGTLVRTVNELALYEVGPVVSPAYLDTDAQARSALRALAETRSIDFEEVVRCAEEGNLRDIVRADATNVEERGTVKDEEAEAPVADHAADRLLVARARLRLVELNARTTL